jgi:MFS transporter, FHS family, L-fucose permease
LMLRVSAAWLMTSYALANIALCIYAILIPNYSGLLALVATSFFMSLMFPTIFALSVKNLGSLAKPGASLVVMAIIGGAVLTAVMGLVSDLTNIHIAVVVPLVCFVVIALYARRCYLSERAEKHTLEKLSIESVQRA